MIDITAVKNFKDLSISVRLLLTLVSISNDAGEIRTNKEDLAKAVGSSRQTVGSHLCEFARCNLIKYKYSGTARLNPDFYFTGRPEKKASAQMEYSLFKSDI